MSFDIDCLSDTLDPVASLHGLVMTSGHAALESVADIASETSWLWAESPVVPEMYVSSACASGFADSLPYSGDGDTSEILFAQSGAGNVPPRDCHKECRGHFLSYVVEPTATEPSFNTPFVLVFACLCLLLIVHCTLL